MLLVDNRFHRAAGARRSFSSALGFRYRMVYRASLPGLAILALLVLLSPAAGANAGVPRGFVGVDWDWQPSEGPLSVQRRELGRMAGAGVAGVRVMFSWARAQPDAGGPFDFSATDAVVSAASLRGVSLLPIVMAAPRWARQGQGDRYPFTPPARDSDYTAYLTALIDRYGPRGAFWDANPSLPRRPLREWQIWNEPHLQYQWTSAPGVDWAPGYVDLLRAAYTAVKRADPGAKVVLAALTNDSWHPLAKIYRQGGGRSFDIAAVNPYTRQPAGVVEIVRRFRAVMARHADARKPLWATELGLPASKGRTPPTNTGLETTDAGMASWLREAYRRLVAARSRAATRVDRAYWYTWASPYRGSNSFGYAGLFSYSTAGAFKPRPAYRAFTTVTRRLARCSKRGAARCL